ncbi:hypothetical protein TA3x_005119 [Tundrisphaera sp. TA3]|uniref:hypothetical protein n=1 Tax=Tundrisphaera sp. TA3 TaxID=3435775 RepID=UPI003EBAF864
METQLWSQKIGEKSAYFLTLRGTQIYQLKVTGSKFSIRKNVNKFLEALAAGQPPAEAGGKVVSEMDAQNIVQAELSPGNGTLSLGAEGPGSKDLNFSPEDDRADLIWEVIRSRTGRDFQPTPTEIGAGEAVLPPIILGAVAGVFWGILHNSASRIAAGEEIEAAGRRRGLQRIFIGIAETIGTTGSIAIGVALLVLVLGWAIRRLVVRPVKTVWKPASA